jgi:predicted nucleotidyltransferase
MKERILEKIYEMEEKENVKVLHAVESGSRAWGFESPDSDYDVRFIYMRPKEFYLRLDKTRDVIEWQLDETLDINGWDLHKTLRLIHSSNPTIFEWAKSPIIYKTMPEWDLIKAEMPNYFQIKAGLYHYHSTALNTYKKQLNGEFVRLKKYFYVLRPMLACMWILHQKTVPPMLFSELVDIELEEEIKPVVDNLLTLKMQTPEFGERERIPQLDEYIEKNLDSLKIEIDSLPPERKTSWENLNKLFVNILK